MIERVYRRVRAASGLSRVVVLTDDERIAEAVETFGGEVEMTPSELRQRHRPDRPRRQELGSGRHRQRPG